jgi:hypothetical protein
MLWLERAALWHATAVTLIVSKHPVAHLPGVSTHPLYRSIAHALGMTVELLSKAIIVQKNGMWSPPKPGKGHGISDILNEAGISLGPRLLEVAKGLEQHVRWMARYPDSIKPEARNFGRLDSILADYNEITAALLVDLTAANKSLFAQFVREYGATQRLPTLGVP